MRKCGMTTMSGQHTLNVYGWVIGLHDHYKGHEGTSEQLQDIERCLRKGEL